MIVRRVRVAAVLAVMATAVSLLVGVARAEAAAPVAGTFVALSPARVLDTRTGTGAPKARVAAFGTLGLQVTGRGGVPSSGVGAVLLNVTVANPAAAGYLTAYPAGSARPTASNLNFAARQTVPNLVAVKVGTGGTVALYNGSGGTVDLVADVAGYYVDGTATRPGTLAALTPTRLLDTRTGVGAPKTPVAANGTVHLQVTGGVVPTGAAAVLLNVTVADASGGGYITAYPDDATRPTASNLNFAAGQTVPALVAVKLSSLGRVALVNGSPGTVRLVADVAGYYLGGTPTDAGAFVPLSPARLLDTRTGPDGSRAPVAPGGTAEVFVKGRAGVPSTGVAAVLLNVTVVNPKAAGYLTAYRDGVTRPTASNLNFVAGQTVANLVSVPVNAGGIVTSAQLYNGSGGSTDVVADIAGYVVAPRDDTPPGPVTGLRVTSISADTVGLAWTNPTGSDFAGAMVRRALGPTPPASVTAGTLVGDTGENSIRQTGLAANTTYSYAVFAHDAVPNYAASATVSLITGYPPVTGARATATTSSTIALTWTNPGDPSFAGVEIRRAVGSTPPASPNAGTFVTDTAATTFTDTGLTPSTTYSYALFAHDVEGRDADGATVTARTTAVAPPTGIVANLGAVDWSKDSVYYGWRNWADPDVVRLYTDPTGRLGIATYHPSSSTIGVQSVDPSSGTVVGPTRTITLPSAFPVWGGMYAAPTGDFYVAVGRDNPNEVDTLDVVAIQRYSSAWALLGTAYVEGGASQGIKGIYSPFDAGAAHMALVGSKLVLHMSRLLYAIDGVHHQADMTVEVDVPTMTATPFSQLGGAPYSSHSFQQLVTTQGDDLVLLDHGDAYPRAVQMSVVADYPTGRSVASTDLVDIAGAVGNNDTGLTLTGVASGPSGIVAIGNSIAQDGSGSIGDQRNVYAVAADPATGAHTLRWLTSFAANGSAGALQPRVVQVAADRFAVLFTVVDGSAVRTEYRLLDSTGSVKASATFAGLRFAAGTDPVEVGTRVLWTGRASSGSTGYVYGLDVTDPTRPTLLG